MVGAWRAQVPMPSPRRNQPSTSNLFIKVTTPTHLDTSPPRCKPLLPLDPAHRTHQIPPIDRMDSP
ncbi:hypothetical protein B0T18DRAFT_410529 [Schizothecium vesticola]|uniref:Uncharacterized protein n=1 Tax=Schizothecium vesticola TaxID=314040 RepID=A0AA40EV08_9PEZI|nr:hypothetical protein B0T18DRAFT_410529 [Schizothecium vesticola]